MTPDRRRRRLSGKTYTPAARACPIGFSVRARAPPPAGSLHAVNKHFVQKTEDRYCYYLFIHNIYFIYVRMCLDYSEKKNLYTRTQYKHITITIVWRKILLAGEGFTHHVVSRVYYTVYTYLGKRTRGGVDGRKRKLITSEIGGRTSEIDTRYSRDVKRCFFPQLCINPPNLS